MSQIIASTYELLEEIGAGGGGVVYLGNHLRLGKKIVLKVDKRKLSTKQEVLRREVDALKNLSHMYIPQVYDFFIEDEKIYTVMAYVEGESFDKPLKRGEKFEQAQVIKWACQLLEALKYLHSPTHGDPPKGIVHSDIKPANIMLTSQGDICLIDFNIALALGEEHIIGRSEGYASPEHYGLDFSNTNMPQGKTHHKTSSRQAPTTILMDEAPKPTFTSTKKKIVPDVRSDIYSLGATLYHLLTGVRPASNAQEVDKITDPGVSKVVADIIAKAMHPNPNLRYQSAEEMLYDFQHLRHNDRRMRLLRRTKRGTLALCTATFILGVVTTGIGLKRMEATQNAYAMAEYSQSALSEADVPLALDYALKALPDQASILVPPYVAEAKKALADAMGVYDLSDGYSPTHIVKLPSQTLHMDLSPDGKTGLAIYAYELVVFSTDTGQIIDTLPILESALADARFIDNSTMIYAGKEGVCAYDIKNKTVLWQGNPASKLAISGDGKIVATVYKDENIANVYDIQGNKKCVVSFDNNKQQIPANDSFGNPNDNLFELNDDGKLLAVSFKGGGLTVFDVDNQSNSIIIYDESEFTHFEGGFHKEFFAFSGTNQGASTFAVIDTKHMEQTGGFESSTRFGVAANKSGIFLSNANILVDIDPTTGEQQELAYTDADIESFSVGELHTAVITTGKKYIFFDKQSNKLTEYSNPYMAYDFISLGGDYALVGSRDTPELTILKVKEHEDADVLAYDRTYQHDEARINEQEDRVMLFAYKGFSVYTAQGELVKEVSIPAPEEVYDQQYSKASGNLAVMYRDALRIYSGMDGALIYEVTDLKSVFYAAYGVSTLDQEGNVSLVNIDTGNAQSVGKAQGDFAAFVGQIVDSDFLDGGELIGAYKNNEQYIFVVSNEESCMAYDGTGKQLFEVPGAKQAEAFFTDKAMIISPLHGTPIVYDLKTGKQICTLEKEAYLTYVTQLEGYVIAEYISIAGERYGMLLDEESFETLAYLPGFTDTINQELVFDYHSGKLRKTRIYSIEELIKEAKNRRSDKR